MDKQADSFACEELSALSIVLVKHGRLRLVPIMVYDAPSLVARCLKKLEGAPGTCVCTVCACEALPGSLETSGNYSVTLTFSQFPWSERYRTSVTALCTCMLACCLD